MARKLSASEELQKFYDTANLDWIIKESKKKN